MSNSNVIDGHELARLFPQVVGAEYEALKKSIGDIGQQHPIVVWEGQILDGRARYRACTEIGLVPETRGLPWGADPVEYLLAANIHRRNLTPSQKAMIGAKLATMRQGQRTDLASRDAKLSQTSAADAVGVGRSSIQRAKMVRDAGNEALIEHVEKGLMDVKVAAKVVKLRPDQQAAVIAAPESKARTMIKQGLRAQREAELAQQLAQASEELATDAREYAVIYADPPWRFDPYGPGGMDRAADNHYPTMPLHQIKTMTIPAAPDSVLFLWATAPMLPQALDVMKSWGFAYKTHCIWIKDRIGTGYWFRSAHELLLVGTMGMIPAPAPGDQPTSFFDAPVGGHSAKPLAAIEMIEALFPSCLRLELFAKSSRPRDGWVRWGAEATASAGAAA